MNNTLDTLGAKIAISLFPTIDIIDADDSYFYGRFEGKGVITASVGSFMGSGSILFPIKAEKYGEHTKLFSGATAINRLIKYMTA